MRNATILITILSVTFMLSAADATAEDKVYRWVDENGEVHYGDHPGGKTVVEEVDIKKGPTTGSRPSSAPTPGNTGEPAEVSYAQQRRDERAKNRKDSAQQQQAIDAGCTQRRQLVANLEPSTRVMVTGEDGEVYRMDDKDRLDTLAEAKAYIAEKCDK